MDGVMSKATYTANGKSPHRVNETSTHNHREKKMKEEKNTFSCKTKMACTCSSIIVLSVA